MVGTPKRLVQLAKAYGDRFSGKTIAFCVKGGETMFDSRFLLQVADALVSEVGEKTDAVLEAARRLEQREGFTEQLKGVFSSASKLVRELKRNLELALKLCDRIPPEIELDDGKTAAHIKARALFQLGMIAIGQNQLKEAVKFFEESLKAAPTQVALYNIAFCYLQMKGWFTDRTQDAIDALEKCISLDPESEIAIEAGKELARLGRL
jgi:tetratricopeptide (TPR) repeat protein